MSRNELRLAGWLSFFEAALTVPYLAFIVLADTTPGSFGAMADVVLSIISLSVFAYILFCFKQLLNEMDFHETDTLIDFMVLMNALFVLVEIAAAFIAPLNTLATLAAVFLFVVTGVAGVLFALRIKGMEHDLWGLQPLYWRSFLISSVAYATVVLLPVGLIAGLVSGVTLGRIFWRAGEHAGRAT
jgi:hypothetical protein